MKGWIPESTSNRKKIGRKELLMNRFIKGWRNGRESQLKVPSGRIVVVEYLTKQVEGKEGCE